MSVRNVIFDVGGVLLEWNPASTIAKLHPDAATHLLIGERFAERAFGPGGPLDPA